MRYVLMIGLIACASCAMQKRTQTVCQISSACRRQLEELHHDIPRFHTLCYTSFMRIAQNAPYKKLSDVLQYDIACSSLKDLSLCHATPAYYVQAFLKPQLEQMDALLRHETKVYNSRYAGWVSLAENLERFLNNSAWKYQYYLIDMDRGMQELQN